MHSLKHPFVMLRAIALFAVFCSASLLKAQEGPNDIVYKFTVQGISDPATAKNVHVTLLQVEGFTSCAFIEGPNLFRMTASTPQTYDGLRAVLQTQGYELGGPVIVSDGTTLGAPQATPEAK